jgi:hypothetical protein
LLAAKDIQLAGGVANTIADALSYEFLLECVMQAYHEGRPHILWGGLDERGYFRGTFRHGSKLLAIGIAVPGEGSPPQPGPLHTLHIEGERVGSMPNLKAAQALAELHLLSPHNRQTDKKMLAELGLLTRRGARRV